MIKISAIIVAGGSGKRMGASIPKQFLPLGNSCVLMHTIMAFAKHETVSEIICVLPQSEIAHWKQLCEQYNFTIEHNVVAGGKERFHSVSNGLNAAQSSYVAIHDGVRPFVSQQTLDNCFRTLKVYQAVAPVVASKESVRLIEDNTNKALNRVDVRLVQTPQCFDKASLSEAFETGYHTFFTDDASVYEHHGGTITLVEGNEENIKITTPMDLAIAEKILLPKL
jgi:2-C-methyl-D-erythritol 4-phosphate cytidylyltransferase